MTVASRPGAASPHFLGITTPSTCGLTARSLLHAGVHASAFPAFFPLALHHRIRIELMQFPVAAEVVVRVKQVAGTACLSGRAAGPPVRWSPHLSCPRCVWQQLRRAWAASGGANNRSSPEVEEGGADGLAGGGLAHEGAGGKDPGVGSPLVVDVVQILLYNIVAPGCCYVYTHTRCNKSWPANQPIQTWASQPPTPNGLAGC